MGLNPPNHQNEDISMIGANTQLSELNAKQRLTDDRIGSAGRHNKIRKLAARGLTTKKISNELKISMSEVELILSLGKK